VDKPSRFWRVAAIIFAVVNVGGAIYAAAMGEWMHAATHVALLGGGYLAWQFIPRPGDGEEIQPDEADAARLNSLQESVDSIALNVERIGEAQRFQEKVLKERAAKSAPPPSGGD
jgi:hypothetical protein